MPQPSVRISTSLFMYLTPKYGKILNKIKSGFFCCYFYHPNDGFILDFFQEKSNILEQDKNGFNS